MIYSKKYLLQSSSLFSGKLDQKGSYNRIHVKSIVGPKTER